jgi:hypothetical protein
MNSPPAVTVHGFAQACNVLRPGRPVTLLSAPGAALYAGCLWWFELVAAAREKWPATPCIDILDCADAAGRAMAALRVGQKMLILDPASPAFPAVRAAAATLGASVLGERPPALDVAALDLAKPYGQARLLCWLEGDPHAAGGRAGDTSQGLR